VTRLNGLRQAILDRIERLTDGPRGRDQVALFWGHRRRLADRIVASFYYTVSARRWASRAESPDHVRALVAGLDHCKEPASALDLGTGAGAAAAAIARRFPSAKVTAVDHNRTMLRTARIRNGLPNIEYVRATYSLPFPTASFDVVCALNAAPELSEVRRVVKEDGHILIASTFFAEAYDGWVARWREMGFELVETESTGEGHWELYRPAAA